MLSTPDVPYLEVVLPLTTKSSPHMDTHGQQNICLKDRRKVLVSTAAGSGFSSWASVPETAKWVSMGKQERDPRGHFLWEMTQVWDSLKDKDT